MELGLLYKNCSTVPLPLPWCLVFLRNWVAFVAALGERYDGNPAVVAVKVCGINGQTMEQVLPFKNVSDCSPQPVDPAQQWAAKGYTPAKIVEAWSTIMNAYERAFPRTNLILMTGPWGLPG